MLCEVQQAVNRLSSGWSPGSNGIQVEPLKHRGSGQSAESYLTSAQKCGTLNQICRVN